MLIREVVHLYVHNISVLDRRNGSLRRIRYKDALSFVILIFILMHWDGTVPSVVLGVSGNVID